MDKPIDRREKAKNEKLERQTLSSVLIVPVSTTKITDTILLVTHYIHVLFLSTAILYKEWLLLRKVNKSNHGSGIGMF